MQNIVVAQKLISGRAMIAFARRISMPSLAQGVPLPSSGSATSKAWTLVVPRPAVFIGRPSRKTPVTVPRIAALDPQDLVVGARGQGSGRCRRRCARRRRRRARQRRAAGSGGVSFLQPDSASTTAPSARTGLGLKSWRWCRPAGSRRWSRLIRRCRFCRPRSASRCRPWSTIPASCLRAGRRSSRSVRRARLLGLEAEFIAADGKVDVLLAGVALDVLGDDRGSVLARIADCRRCRRLVLPCATAASEPGSEVGLALRRRRCGPLLLPALP